MPRKKTALAVIDPVASPDAPDTVSLPKAKKADIRVSEVSRAREIARKRIESGDVRPTQTQVPLKKQEEPMTTRWANTSISGRAYDLVDHKGWVAVRYEELRNPGNGEFKQTPDGLVSRGANGHQILYKIPSAVYKEIAFAKARREHSRLGSKQKMSQGAAEAAATKSDKAATAVENFGIDQFEASRSFEPVLE